jgi:peptide/nickel transport system substrate-binding protein
MSIKKKALAVLALTLVLCASFASGIDTVPRYGGTLVLIHWEDPKSMNPDAQVDDAGALIFRNIYNQLFVLTRDYDVIPDLAYAWEASPDAKVWTFHLYPNATWHDGVPVTSKDVKFTFEAIKKFKGVSYGRIKAQNIERIECPNDYTVVFNLNTSFAPFLCMLSWYGTWIMPEHIWGNATDWLDPTLPYLTKPVGSGPFKLVEWVRGEHITLEPYANYHLGKPYVSKVVVKIIPTSAVALQAFMAQEGDVLVQAPELSQIPLINATLDTRVISYPTASRWYIGMNLQRSLFQDVRVRQALAYAINRSEINEKACQGFNVPAKYHYTPAVAWAINPDAVLPDCNPSEAERLLDEAGYLKDANGKRFTITYRCWTGPTEESIGEVIKDQLAKVGIEVVLQVSEFNIWEDTVIKKREFDIALCDGFQGPDPSNFVLRVGSKEYINFAGYNNSKVDTLFDEGVKETDLEKRKEIYWEIQAIVAEDLPYIWILEVTGFGIWHTYFKDLWFENAWSRKVGIQSCQYTYWEQGFSPSTFKDVEAAINKAKAENRTVGLNASELLYQQALQAFEDGDYVHTADLCQQAILKAQQATTPGEPPPPPETGTPIETIAAVVVAVVIVLVVGTVYYTKKRKKT